MVIDPDSWLVKSVSSFINRVTKGHALGQAAYYYGSRTAQALWKELCENNCDVAMDLVGVPYVVQRDDLAEIAPLWKYYVLKIKYRLEASTPGHEQFASKYEHLDVNWASEMYGYNMAAAHLGIKHEVVFDLQVRDVDGERTFEQCKNKVSVHMGRAWFPRGHEMAKQYIHTEGKSFRHFGDQVWCKCNFTASTVPICPPSRKITLKPKISSQELVPSCTRRLSVLRRRMSEESTNLPRKYQRKIKRISQRILMSSQSQPQRNKEPVGRSKSE